MHGEEEEEEEGESETAIERVRENFIFRKNE